MLAERLQQEAHKLMNPDTAESVQMRTLPVLCYMASLLCEHGDFDRVREEQPSASRPFPARADAGPDLVTLLAAIKSSIDALTPNSVAELTYGTLIRVYNLSLPAQIKSTVLTSLGFVYRAHPTLMLHQASTTIIDAIFESEAPQMHHQILRIVQDFLASQERAVAVAATLPADKKRKKAVNGVKMEELVGNVEGFADSGCVPISLLTRRGPDPDARSHSSAVSRAPSRSGTSSASSPRRSRPTRAYSASASTSSARSPGRASRTRSRSRRPSSPSPPRATPPSPTRRTRPSPSCTRSTPRSS